MSSSRVTDAKPVPMMQYRTCELEDSEGPVAVRYCHTVLDAEKPWIVVVLPFGIPAEVVEPAFVRLQRTCNVVSWESRYTLSLDVRFTGEESLAPADHVADMIGILGALEIDRCALLGYCSGGGIALLAAKLHGERFTDLILVNGEYQLFRRGHMSTAYQRSIDSFLPLVAVGRKEAHSMFETMAEVVGATAQEQSSELLKQMNRPFSSEEHLFRYAKSYMAYRDFDALDVASAVKQTALVVAGLLDEHTNMENSVAIAERISRSTTFIDAEGDHYAFCHAGSATLEAIASHLDVSCRNR